MKNSGLYAPIKHQDSYGQHRGGLRGRMCAGNPPRCSSLSLVLFARTPITHSSADRQPITVATNTVFPIQSPSGLQVG